MGQNALIHIVNHLFEKRTSPVCTLLWPFFFPSRKAAQNVNDATRGLSIKMTQRKDKSNVGSWEFLSAPADLRPRPLTCHLAFHRDLPRHTLLP